MDCGARRRDPFVQPEGSQALDDRNRTGDNTMLDAQALADRYVAAWNEPSATRRANAIAALWAPDATGRERGREGCGYGGLGKLILGSPERNGGESGIRYRAAPTARLRGDVLTFRWEMLLADSETVLASGLEFLVVDEEGRIVIDHPFAVA
jgi:hypothetical protein